MSGNHMCQETGGMAIQANECSTTGRANPTYDHHHHPDLSANQRQRITSSSLSSSFSGRPAALHFNGNADNPVNEEHQSPAVVNNTIRNPTGNGHAHGRRAASICLPIDQDVVREIGTSLRRISDEFDVSRRRREMLSNSESGLYWMMHNLTSSVGLSRRSLSSRFRSHHIQLNGRPRSFSTNDADDADVEE